MRWTNSLSGLSVDLAAAEKKRDGEKGNEKWFIYK